jgi:Ca2+-binding RTX toxin-like protein
MNRSHKYIYKIQVPHGDTGVSKIYGGHGNSFGVGYSDSSFIYYTNDTYIETPNYFDNYKLAGFATPIGGLQADTVIGGQQSDGKYWKEIFHNGYYIGYKNVPKERVELFDKSLITFRRTK